MRNLLAGYAHQSQETIQDSGGIGGRLGGIGVEAAQVDEKDPVERRVPGQHVSGVDRQLGLADPGHTGEGEADQGRRTCRCALPELVQLGCAAGESRQILREGVLDPDRPVGRLRARRR